MARKISHIIMMGDSLSDRGTMSNRFLLGFIPMRWVSGLSTYSPKGRFTNGLAWSDHLSAIIASQFTIDEIKNKTDLFKKRENWNDADNADDILTGRYNKRDSFKKQKALDDSDIADYIAAKDTHVLPHVRNHYALNNDLAIRYKNQEFVRNYDEGGLTAHDYSWRPSKSISRFFSRLILSTLDDKRKKLLAYDKDHQSNWTPRHKKETLIIEWSGANDLITVNEKPSMDEAKKAVRERIKNVEELIKNGYRNFVLFDLPMLSLTPRFQRKIEDERKQADECCQRFNDELMRACEVLREKYPGCSINVFKVSEKFDHIYHSPEIYDLNGTKLAQPYTESTDFDISKNGTSPSDGYMFWDDVHPTADMHALIAKEFHKQFSTQSQYAFSRPEKEDGENNASAEKLCEDFKKEYKQKLAQDKRGFFGLFRNNNLDIDFKTEKPKEILKKILRHGLHGGKNNRTREILIQLKWIDKDDCLENIPILIKAKNKLAVEMHREELEAFRQKLDSQNGMPGKVH